MSTLDGMAAAPIVTPPTRAEWVDGLLRKAILHGALLPGEKLYAERLADQWGVSATPVRETFQRLAGEGCVGIEPQRGPRVAPLILAQAAEISDLRMLPDPVEREHSVQAAAGDAAFAAEVEAAHTAVARRHRAIADYHDAHKAFHLALVSRCPNVRLVRQVAELLDHSLRFQAIGAVTVRRGNPAEEHRVLAAAAVAGRAADAATVLRAHLQATLDAVRASG